MQQNALNKFNKKKYLNNQKDSFNSLCGETFNFIIMEQLTGNWIDWIQCNGWSAGPHILFLHNTAVKISNKACVFVRTHPRVERV